MENPTRLVSPQALDTRGTAVVAVLAERLVANAVAERRIPAADRGFWLDAAKRNLSYAQRLIANIASNTAPALGGPSRPAGGALPGLTREELAVARQLHLDPMALAKEKAKGLS